MVQTPYQLYPAEPARDFRRIPEFWLSPDLAGSGCGIGHVWADLCDCSGVHLFLSLFLISGILFVKHELGIKKAGQPVKKLLKENGLGDIDSRFCDRVVIWTLGKKKKEFSGD
jgi:hypothetical protein